MELFNRMFAEKILRFHEGTNKVLRAMMKMPFLKSHVHESVFDKENVKARMWIGALSQLVEVILEFIRKLLYVALLIYVPYLLISQICPLVRLHQELAIVYMFFMMSLVCGSLANNTLLAMGDRDYLMIKVMMLSPYMNFLGRLAYKMFTEFIYYSIILTIFGVHPVHAMLLSLATSCARPIGEMAAIICFDHMKSLYNSRNTYNGMIMAVCVLLAYGLPILNRRISYGWEFAFHPMFVVIMIAAGTGAVYYLWCYPHYRTIMREAMHIKRED